MKQLPQIPNIPTISGARDADAAVRSLLEYLGRLKAALEPVVYSSPLARGEIAQGTPGAGKYPDGGTDPATWTTLPAFPSQKRVLQYVSGTATGGSTSSTTLVDVPGATLSITPASVANKVLVLYSARQIINSGSGAGDNSQARLLAAGSPPANSDRFLTTEVAGGNSQSTAAWTYLDSPASVASVTYKLQHQVNVVAGTPISTIGNILMVLLEIEG